MLKVSDVEKLQKSAEILWESPIYLMNEPNSRYFCMENTTYDCRKSGSDNYY